VLAEADGLPVFTTPAKVEGYAAAEASHTLCQAAMAVRTGLSRFQHSALVGSTGCLTFA
jgi:hypothetical protein